MDRPDWMTPTTVVQMATNVEVRLGPQKLAAHPAKRTPVKLPAANAETTAPSISAGKVKMNKNKNKMRK